MQCAFISIYIGTVKPFEEKLSNYMEMFNEITIMAITYHLFLLTDFMPDTKSQYDVGYSLIMITCLNILVNMGIIIILGGGKLILNIRKFRKNYPMYKEKVK
jgi:hypothetical protein